VHNFFEWCLFLILLKYVYTKQAKFEIPFAEPTCSKLDLFDTFFWLNMCASVRTTDSTALHQDLAKSANNCTKIN